MLDAMKFLVATAFFSLFIDMNYISVSEINFIEEIEENL